MNIKLRFLRRIAPIGTALAALCAAPARGQDAAADPPPGIAADRWQRWRSHLRERQFSEDDARACAAPLREAAQLGFEIEPLMLRLEEGAAKGADASALRTSVENRWRHMRTAAEILQKSNYPLDRERAPSLLGSAALALESGIEAESLVEVLSRGGGGQIERMRSILEAGETLRLNGMDEPTVRQLMLDFLDRNLRRMEIQRAVRFVAQQQLRNMEGQRIRRQLWGGNGAGWRGGAGDRASPGHGFGGARETQGGGAGTGSGALAPSAGGNGGQGHGPGPGSPHNP